MPAIMRLNHPPFGTFRMAEERYVASMVANTTKKTAGNIHGLRHTVRITCGCHNVER